MATDITPGAPADQPGGAQPSQAKQASKRTSGQAAVIPGRPQAGGPPTTEAQSRCHGCGSECVHHSGFNRARRVWAAEKLGESRRSVGSRCVDCRLLSPRQPGKGGILTVTRRFGSDTVETRGWKVEFRLSFGTDARAGGNTSENDTGSEQNCGENLKTSICKQQLLCLGLVMTSICSKCVTIKSSQQNI